MYGSEFTNYSNSPGFLQINYEISIKQGSREYTWNNKDAISHPFYILLRFIDRKSYVESIKYYYTAVYD